MSVAGSSGLALRIERVASSRIDDDTVLVSLAGPGAGPVPGAGGDELLGVEVRAGTPLSICGPDAGRCKPRGSRWAFVLVGQLRVARVGRAPLGGPGVALGWQLHDQRPAGRGGLGPGSGPGSGAGAPPRSGAPRRLGLPPGSRLAA